MKFGYFCSVNCGLVWACDTIQKRFDKRKEFKNPLPPQENAKLMALMEKFKKRS